jgi:Uma2 family endonuclease
VNVEMIVPTWMWEQVSADDYDSWTEEQCERIEIIDGMIRLMPPRSAIHARVIGKLAQVLDRSAGPEWYSASNVDLRIRDSPLHNLRPDVFLYRSEMIESNPARPDQLLLVAEVVSPGTETADRIMKPIEYARSGISYYWRVEGAATALPIMHTYVLDPATMSYRATEVFSGVVTAIAPFPVELDLRKI